MEDQEGGVMIDDLQSEVARFCEDRDWGQFHSPKNLSMALAGEAGELLAIFQWLTENQSKAVMAHPATAAQVRDEVADVFIYLLRLAGILDLDLPSAVRVKIARNSERYPVATARGSAAKWTDQIP